MIQAEAKGRRITLGADEAYGTAEHLARLHTVGVMQHVSQQTSRRHPAIDGRATRATRLASACALRSSSTGSRPTAGLRKTRYRGLIRVGWVVTLSAAACTLAHLFKLLAKVA